ncbi:bpX6 domain-containing protein [Nannocystis radixulma]|uniref:BpX6 domain-containing protein n=1 Tax=Nannocystis radixulma TaxID=2995305 RepID=A0ABT5B9K4_9BACT|nr:bpX6 domain-containing protein [Nannocystis radixulma]MDC0670813.1 bpX6 domain-containing protein [Nannocystis radixulma]
MTVHPRHTVHRGSVEAIGVIVTAFAGDLVAARRRVLDVWQPGATVFAVADDAWFVLWPQARRLRCDRAPGLPVAAHGRWLVSAPLADDELAALDAPTGALVHVRRGACEIITLERPVDPSEWLAVDDLELVEVGSLGDPPRPAAASQDPRPVRAIFNELVGPPPPAARAVAAAMWAAAARREQARIDAQALARSAAARSGAIAGEASKWVGGAVAAIAVVMLFTIPGAAVPLLGVLAAIPVMVLGAAGIRRILGESGPAPAPPPRPASPPPPPASPPPRWRLLDAISRFLEYTGLLRLLGRQHAQYLRRLVDMFERGDYGEALRHAIPLGGGADDTPGASPLGPLGARKDLQIRPGAVPAKSSLLLESSDFSYLRKLYRKAFDRLAHDGRIDEAAFMLAELLHAHEEAVAFLERHGRGRVAAEIAEARGLPPGMVVRQWFLAGDRERAVLVARRKGAFADAVARLEREPERRDEAAALRLAWAETLATAGDYEAAVGVATPVSKDIPQIRQWMTDAIERGGPPGARMLARKLQRFDDALGEHLDLLARLTDPDDPTHTDARVHMLATFAAGNMPEPVRSAARPLVRALLADAARGEQPIDEPQFRKLALMLRDDALRVDLPAWPKPPPPEPLHQAASPRAIVYGLGDVGAIAVLDLAVLPDGALLVALGELGVRLYDRAGKLRWHADQPAHSLVVSDHGDRAIAVAPRGPDVVRLARLDLVRRKAASWCEARLARWAASFDGHTWLVAETSPLRPDRTPLVIVDTLVDAELRALDRRDLDDAEIVAIARAPVGAVVTVVRGPDALERWRWDLPDWTLRRREPVLGPRPADAARTLGLAYASAGRFERLCTAESPRGEHVSCHRADIAGLAPLLHVSREDQRAVGLNPPGDGPQLTGDLSGLPGAPLQVVVDGPWLAVALRFETCLEVHIITVADRQTRAVVTLAGARRAALRLVDPLLAIADDRGRVLAIDLRDGALRRSLRVV